METFFRNLWNSIRYSEWFNQLPEWLREPPGLYVAFAAMVTIVVWMLVVLVRRLLRSSGRFTSAQERALKKQYRGNLRREIRQLRRNGDLLAVGQRYEALGDTNAALDAYRRGGCHAETADLLLRQGKRERAREAAAEGQVWALYAEICKQDGDHAEAAAAYQRDGQYYAAARSFEEAGKRFEAARCYSAAGMEYNAAQLLMDGEGRRTAEALEAAIRSSLDQARGTSMSVDMVAAVRRCAQLWLAEDQAERAYRLATDSEQWEVAAPIARDYLEPEPAMTDVCIRAGAYLAAAEICKKLGDTRQEALHRAEHFQSHDNAAEAAHWFETAEEWSQAAEQRAACDEPRRAAELYEKAENYYLAAKMYADAGDEAKSREMEAAALARDPELESGEATAAQMPVHHPAPQELPAPSDRYAIEEEIGRGGMGIVYRARDILLKRAVAYKVLPAELSGAEGESKNLLAEARAAARLSHPNIVQIYDAGFLGDDGFFVVMELIAGEPFSKLLKQRRLSVNGVIYVARQICAALAHAHQRRIIHRDLKPSNLMWTPEKQIKLTDFGLARVIEDSLGKVLTRAAGTPYYMSPEQIRGDPVDERTDLYSFGCVLFEMLCNRTPFSGGSSSIFHHLNTQPTDPRASRREIPEPLAAIILQCLEKDVDKRPSSAEELGKALAELA
ncbi:MAG: protein kinase [bacterium]|nr:protein kinase [bacterium]